MAYKCCWRGKRRWQKIPVGIISVKESPIVNDNCYLSPLGNCSAKVTKEHFISRNILEMMLEEKRRLGICPRLHFTNARHFFGGKSEVEIGIDSFSAKVLCDSHNSALSEIDTAAGLAFSTIMSLAADVESIAGNRIRKMSFYLSSGLDVERWMIKVYCGLLASGKIKSASGLPLERSSLDRSLLESLLGSRSLPSPLGLYMHTFVGQQRQAGGFSFSTIKLSDGSDDVGGLMLSLGLMNFVLVTSERYGRAFVDENWYRHQTLAWNVRQNGSRLGYLFTY